MLLGIDIGTTKTAAVLIAADGAVASVATAEHRVGVSSPAGRFEQDPAALLESVRQCIHRLPLDARLKVMSIGITGQMHGVVVLDARGRPMTPLITWQDQRCQEDPAFLPRLAQVAGRRLSPGYGCATLAWLVAHGRMPAGAKAACTIQDWLVMRLCALRRPITDPTDAASWGCFDLETSGWDRQAADSLGIEELLPDVHPCAEQAGLICTDMAKDFGLPADTPVAVAVGDNAASFLATVQSPDEELALTLGTGGQVSAILPPGAPSAAPQGSSYEYRPFPGNRFLATAASLCGGSAWAWLVETVRNWQRDTGSAITPCDELYRRLNELGMTAPDGPVVEPTFLGERHFASKRGTIANITLDNFTLGQLARGLARGIISNLRSMLPPQVLVGRTRLVGSGNALRRNPLLAAMAKDIFGLPLRLTAEQEEAACGAAMLAEVIARK